MQLKLVDFQSLQLFLRLRSLLVTNPDRDVLSDASSFLRFRNDSLVICRISLKPLFSCYNREKKKHLIELQKEVKITTLIISSLLYPKYMCKDLNTALQSCYLLKLRTLSFWLLLSWMGISIKKKAQNTKKDKKRVIKFKSCI